MVIPLLTNTTGHGGEEERRVPPRAAPLSGISEWVRRRTHSAGYSPIWRVSSAGRRRRAAARLSVPDRVGRRTARGLSQRLTSLRPGRDPSASTPPPAAPTHGSAGRPVTSSVWPRGTEPDLTRSQWTADVTPGRGCEVSREETTPDLIRLVSAAEIQDAAFIGADVPGI